MNHTQDRFRGALLGLAIGDALGTTVEFKPRGSFPPVTDITGGGPFALQPGEWTDDTSMALCLADSLLECDGMDLTDQIDRYVAWWKEGSNSVNGRCFDIGNTVRAALSRYLRTGDPVAGSTDPHSAGNGSIMRLAPVPMFHAKNTAAAARAAATSSLTTHGATEAVDACRLLAVILVGFLNGFSKEEVLCNRFIPDFHALEEPDLCPKIASIAEGDYKTLSETSIRGSGYVVESLRAALWAFWHSDSFEEGALLAVNLGDDADTTGAIYGQIAGTHYGMEGIPSNWLEKLAWRDRITKIADQLHSKNP
jgi:ADP-ribosyl-[dinitrogen reductase] hydrolase